MFFPVQTATTIVKFLIDNFGVTNLFGLDNYEYYAKISGRLLKVEENWRVFFKYPPDTIVSRPLLPLTSNILTPSTRSPNLENQVLLQSSPVHNLPQLSQQQIRRTNNTKTEADCSSTRNNEAGGNNDEESLNRSDLRSRNLTAESTRSLTFLPMVHERQTQRMKARSEWFLTPSDNDSGDDQNSSLPNPSGRAASATAGSSSSRALIRRTSSKEKRLVRRTSSKKDKENGGGGSGGKNSNASVPGTPGSGGSGSSLITTTR